MPYINVPDIPLPWDNIMNDDMPYINVPDIPLPWDNIMNDDTFLSLDTIYLASIATATDVSLCLFNHLFDKKQ